MSTSPNWSDAESPAWVAAVVTGPEVESGEGVAKGVTVGEIGAGVGDGKAGTKVGIARVGSGLVWLTGLEAGLLAKAGVGLLSSLPAHPASIPASIVKTASQ